MLLLTDYFSRLLSLFTALPAYHTDCLSLAGRSVRLNTPSDILRGRLLPALSHLLVEGEPETTGLTIWYAVDADLPDRVTAPPWPGFNAQGFNAALDQEAVQLFFQPWQRQLFLYSRQQRTGIYWVQTAADLPWWEASFPFRALFHFWTRDLPAQLVHAGAVAKAGKSVLITGPSGSGKSTSCLTLLRSGYQYLGDDYVWVELTGHPVVYTLYQTAKVEPDNLKERFSDWMPYVVNKELLGQQKAIFYIRELWERSFIPAAALSAVLLPRVTYQERSLFERIRPAQALLAMAPTTLHHLPHHRQAAYRKLTQISTVLPGFRWSLGSDPQLFEQSIDQLYSDELS
ncbi:hypothetical protein [Niabella beijingensis]|uniref:hypothetical protein n=1 Tax=Niabella beijingensis TaxID=2872700 RepID=UPI001CBD2C82|nr:hypothetical protein [Niabella beijingensis]MBZ4187286.1 hypothetical protein [Niabella beijingensis]